MSLPASPPRPSGSVSPGLLPAEPAEKGQQGRDARAGRWRRSCSPEREGAALGRPPSPTFPGLTPDFSPDPTASRNFYALTKIMH